MNLMINTDFKKLKLLVEKMTLTYNLHTDTYLFLAVMFSRGLAKAIEAEFIVSR